MSKHKLLLADDSVTIQKVVNLTFADEGIEVISVGDGDSAMEKFIEITPDLVMVDVNMPGVDGYRICEMIKQDIETRHVPVILLVGSFEPFDEEEARRVGANDYLTKPFQSIRQLVNKVTVLLNRDNGNKVSAPETAREDEEVVVEDTRAEYYQPTESRTAELGDAGMDDEMIQAKQVGSLPIDEVQRFEGGGTREEPEADVQPEQKEPDYSYASYVGEEPKEEPEELEPDIAKTKPLSSAEFEQITSDPFEQTEGVEQQSPEEDRNSYLEEQMVSEFATEASDEGTSSAEDFTPEPFETESSYTPEEIPDQRPYSFEEADEGFAVEKTEEELPYMEDARRDYETIDDQPASAEYPGGVPESFKDAGEQEPSAPDYFSTPPAPTVESQETAAADEPYSEEQETDSQTDQTEEPFGDPGQSFEQRQDLAGWQTVVDPEEYFKKREQVETEAKADEFAAAPPESFEQTGESYYDEPEIPEPEAPAFAGEIYVEPPVAEIPESTSFAETAQPEIVEEAAAAETAEAEPVEEDTAQAESSEPQEYIREPEETVLTEEAVPQETTEVAAESEEEDETAAAEKTRSKVSSLVSSKDTTDAVESVIVSEFARQSISLSSEAIETIASKIADKISEKIVQEMASEVVSDLADLIVARMERKKLE